MRSDIPVVLIFFNRPSQTMRVVERIIAARPREVYLISDGPRDGRPNEAACVEGLRKAVLNAFQKAQIECHTDFAPSNLGCARRVSSGITAVLSRSECAVILEDDCLPSPGFFSFLENALIEHAKDDAISAVCGSCLAGRLQGEASGVTYYPVIWGWGLWRRSWERYSLKIDHIAPSAFNFLQESGVTDKRGVQEWQRLLAFAQAYPYYTWDAQFVLQTISDRKLAIHPGVNLVKNIGFGGGATHTTKLFNRFMWLRTHESAREESRGIPFDRWYSRFLETEFFHDRLTMRNFPFRLLIKCELMFRKLLMRYKS